MIFNIKNGDLMKFLNVKYALVLNSKELPFGVNWELIQDDYRGSISIYENKDFRPLGTTYNSVLTYEEFMQTNQSLYELNNMVICNNENLEEIKALVKRDARSELNNIQYGGNQLTGDIKSDNGGFMVITLPYDEGWKILVNENEVKKYEVNGGFIGIPINQGENHIEMYFVPKGFKFGLIMSVIGSIMATVLFIFSIKERKKSSI